MKIADLQILFYAIDPNAEHHTTAARWLEDAINAAEPVAIAWPTVHQFLRLGTHLAFAGAMSDDEAMGWIEEWTDAGVGILSDADLSWPLFAELVGASPRALRNAVDDAHLAGIAVSRGATLASFDADFACFVDHGLRLESLGADA
jgi:toxin-antitoxin system PIN domain toxin